MGAKTWMLVSSKDENVGNFLKSVPSINRDESIRIANHLFSNEELLPLNDGDLYYTNPPDDELLVGSFENFNIVAAKEFALDYPSKLPIKFVSDTEFCTLHAMHSVVDWFAFAHWHNGNLVRSLSLSPDSGILENIGTPMDFEKPYWDGEHQEEDYPLPFHPLTLGEAALYNFFGYQLEGEITDLSYDPEEIKLMQFKRSPLKKKSSWWKFSSSRE